MPMPIVDGSLAVWRGDGLRGELPRLPAGRDFSLELFSKPSSMAGVERCRLKECKDPVSGFGEERDRSVVEVCC